MPGFAFLCDTANGNFREVQNFPKVNYEAFVRASRDKNMTDLTEEQIRSLKKSYLNIVGFFLTDDTIASRYLRCLLKWGFQLHLTPDDLLQQNIDLSHLSFAKPADQSEKVEALFHLVYMICLDQVVEDVELEVATRYAEKLGFSDVLVSDLLKSIVTAETDGTPRQNVREQVLDFLELYERGK